MPLVMITREHTDMYPAFVPSDIWIQRLVEHKLVLQLKFLEASTLITCHDVYVHSVYSIILGNIEKC